MRKARSAYSKAAVTARGTVSHLTGGSARALPAVGLASEAREETHGCLNFYFALSGKRSEKDGEMRGQNISSIWRASGVLFPSS